MSAYAEYLHAESEEEREEALRNIKREAREESEGQDEDNTSAG